MTNLFTHLGIVFLLMAGFSITGHGLQAETHNPSWREVAQQRTLRNETMEAKFQAGLLTELTDRRTGISLVHMDPGDLPALQPLLGDASYNLDKAKVSQTIDESSITVEFSWPDGDTWKLGWVMESGQGDLTCHSAARFAKATDEFRVLIPGCNIKDYALVYMHGYGTSYAANAPWTDVFLGDPEKHSSPSSHPHAIVALFEGQLSGWVVEGREERVGPANLMLKGYGDTARLGFSRRFPLGAKEPQMYEIRFRPYQGDWLKAVDPYVEWLEQGAGFLALDKLPPPQVWVHNLKTQAYINVGDFAGLDELAQKVNPRETFVGRQGDFRYHAFDVGYPDYRITEVGEKWLKYARSLGFHVGMHFNIQSIHHTHRDLLEKMKEGFNIIGQDEQGRDIYESIQQGSNIRVSPALKAWRDHLVAQIGKTIEAGIDVVYLDESMSPGGKFVVNGMDGYQGTLEMMKQILRQYPHVAIETEQFNTLTAKYGKLALSQMPLGHPLSGYIYRKYVKVVPEGVMYSPTEAILMDAFDVWGCMLPGADTQREDSWLQIAQAFHQYQLMPAPELPRKQFTRFTSHWTHGLVPLYDQPVPAEGEKLFGFKGPHGVTAYLEKHPAKRGLVVYLPGEAPRWVGTRHSGIRSYQGPGLPVYFGFREKISDWLIYDGQKLLGLDPDQTYWFDPALRTQPERFHLFKVPDDFVGVMSMEARTSPQEVGRDDAYFCLRMAGTGQIGAFVPKGYDVYLDGKKLSVDDQSRQAFAIINASKTGSSGLGYHIQLNQASESQDEQALTGPAYLIAFKKMDTELSGLWIKLPWYGSHDSMKWITGNNAEGYKMAVGAVGRILGKVPRARKVSIQGAYLMNETFAGGTPGDGVIHVNGQEILRVPHGEMPFTEKPFNVDISNFMGQYVVVEFTPDAPVRGHSAQWFQPRFVVE